MNQLFFGDCLDILKDLNAKHPEGFIDLIYIDPPFNSKRDYNVLFEDIDIKDTKAQKEAFADTWSNVKYIDQLNEIQELSLDLYKFLKTLDEISTSKGSVSYLTTMALRIYYMHKVLKDTGSFYLHCDPTMSHYLKVVCDLVFGEKNFRNEIVWKRKTGKGETNQKSNKFGVSTDIILYLAKSENAELNPQFNFDAAGYQDYVSKFFKHKDENGRIFRIADLSSPSPRKNLMYEYKGYRPPKNGWAISLDKMIQWDKEGRLYFPKSKDGRIQRKRFLDELKGKPVQNLWDDIEPIGSQAQERLGYPTQKPEALLERIIQASSNEGDLVADFFCGCGTTIAAAEKLKRNWLGVDISHLAIKLIIDRLTKPYGKVRAKAIRDNIQVAGFPKDIGSAKELAQNTEKGRFGFQDWIIEVMIGGVVNPKKTGDGGWDGHITFWKGINEKGHGLIEVKSGKVNIKNIREFIHVVNKQGADLGIFVCFAEHANNNMYLEMKKEGKFVNPLTSTIDKFHIVTVEELLEGKGLSFLPAFFNPDTFKIATKKLEQDEKMDGLFD